MKRYRALLATTWWLWLILIATAIPLTMWMSTFLVTIPIYLGTFLYFAHVRFDENGERIELE